MQGEEKEKRNERRLGRGKGGEGVLGAEIERVTFRGIMSL